MESANESSEELTPEELKQVAVQALGDLIPRKSKEQYVKAELRFKQWLTSKNTNKISETTLLAYFKEMLAVKAPTSMWSEYSLLKKMLRVNHKIDISQFTSISELLKQESRTHTKKKAATFTRGQVEQYLSSAPNTLDSIQEKFGFLIGIFGGLRSEEYCQIKFEHISEFEDHLKVDLEFRKTDQAGNGTTFFITQHASPLLCPLQYYQSYKKVFEKPEGYVFRRISNGKITKQKRGKTFFYELPKRIATFLKLEHPEKYTGHAIRRTATTWLAEQGASASIIQKFGGWKSSSVAQEYIDDSDNIRQTIAMKLQGENPQAAKAQQESHAEIASKSTSGVMSGLIRASGITINSEKVIIKNIWNSETASK
jgi:integrase